jgi:LacI family transcriptional regulator
VAFDDVHVTPPWPSICADNEQGGYLATRHLLNVGRRDIVALAPQTPAAYVGRRLAGFARALGEAGIDDVERRVIHTADDWSPVSKYSAGVEQLIAAGIPFDAIFAVCDFVAFPAMRSLHRAGLTIPDDVAIVGFDDERGTEIAEPTLSSIRQPYAELGGRLVRALIDRIYDPQLPRQTELVPVQLVVRDSSAAGTSPDGDR